LTEALVQPLLIASSSCRVQQAERQNLELDEARPWSVALIGDDSWSTEALVQPVVIASSSCRVQWDERLKLELDEARPCSVVLIEDVP